MRKWVLRLHLYLGLVCCPYLIVFGVSSLNFNHPFEFTEPAEARVTWERQVALPPASTSNDAESEAVRDALGLVGWTIPWETHRDEDSGGLHFGLARPGKHYTIHVPRPSGAVRVEERREGYWTVIRSLHGNKGVPSATVMTVWGGYTELCTFFVLFAAATGVYLFAARKSERWVGFSVLGVATLLSLLFMVYVRVWG
jgi:hypothetical protein